MGNSTNGLSVDPNSSKTHVKLAEHDPFAPPRISIPPYTVGIWDSDIDLVDVRHLISDPYRQQWDKGNKQTNKQHVLPSYS